MKHIKLFESFLNETEEGYTLDSVKMFIDKKTLMLYPIKGGKPDKTKGISLHDQPDTWFNTLSDTDFGTIDSLLNEGGSNSDEVHNK